MNPSGTEIALVRAAPDVYGIHTGTALSREVSRGTQLRIRRGMYAESQSWSAAQPSQRYAASMAATALSGSSRVFCRESALVLHELPLLKVPEEVHLRTLHRSQVGVREQAGRLMFPTRLHEPALPRGVSRAQHRAEVGTLLSVDRSVDLGSNRTVVAIPYELMTPACLQGFFSDPPSDPTFAKQPGETASKTGLSGLTVPVEPLPLALLDTVPRMIFEEGVVVLDAALARMAREGAELEETLSPWRPFLRTARLQKAWARAVGFADPRAESVGESLSRVRISALGFTVPQLQTQVWVEGREYRLDFEWQGGVVGEFDGKHKYTRSQELFGISTEEALYREKRREDAIRSTGRRVVRWSWEDLHHPHILRDRLLRAGVPRA